MTPRVVVVSHQVPKYVADVKERIDDYVVFRPTLTITARTALRAINEFISIWKIIQKNPSFFSKYSDF